ERRAGRGLWRGARFARGAAAGGLSAGKRGIPPGAVRRGAASPLPQAPRRGSARGACAPGARGPACRGQAPDRHLLEGNAAARGPRPGPDRPSPPSGARRTDERPRPGVAARFLRTARRAGGRRRLDPPQQPRPDRGRGTDRPHPDPVGGQEGGGRQPRRPSPRRRSAGRPERHAAKRLRLGDRGQPARRHRGRGPPAPDLLPVRQARRLRPYRRTREQGRGPGGPAAEPRGYLQPLQREARPMTRILATADGEFRIALRNRWVAIALVLMAVFSLVLSLAGSAPSGGLGVDRLSVTVASLTSLAVYLVPLLALLMSFDAVAGEVERGTLPLL